MTVAVVTVAVASAAGAVGPVGLAVAHVEGMPVVAVLVAARAAGWVASWAEAMQVVGAMRVVVGQVVVNLAAAAVAEVAREGQLAVE